MWILQSNLWKEEKYDTIISLVDRYEIPYTVLDLIPFSDHLDLPCKAEEVQMVFGSIRFAELVRSQGVATHFNDNFNWLVWSDVFKEDCLNWPSKITKISDFELPLDYDIFVRPVLDDKSFTGTVLRAGDTFSSVQFATSKPKEDILIQVAPTRKIFQEYRFFVINGKVITGSIYRSGGSVVYRNLENNYGNIEPTEFAQMMVDKWCPSKMFVIDIASIENGYKIIEFGSIHNCGFYDCDLSKLIQKIQEYNENFKI
jgi:hypothetical protein